MRKMTDTAALSRRQLLKTAPALPLAASMSAGMFPALPGAQASILQRLQAVPGTPPAPDFTLKDTDGQTVRFADFKNKVVLVNFWATWCPPCREEIPSMERAWPKLKEAGVGMLAVHVGGNADDIWAFLGQYGITFPVLIDKSSKVARQWRTIGLPTSYVTDPQGRKALRAIGGREWDHPDLLKSIFALKG